MENLNAEQVKKALECCVVNSNCNGCPLWEGYVTHKNCLQTVCINALALIKSQEQRIKELAEENEAWQKHLISAEEKAGKAYYELACEVEDLRVENENLHASCTELTQSCTKLTEENERLRSDCAKGANALIEEIQKNRTIEADTVRKMQERFKERIKGIYLDEYEAGIIIDELAKELTNEGS